MADRLSPEERAELDSERGYSESSAKEARLREWFSLRESDGGPREFGRLVARLWQSKFRRERPHDKLAANKRWIEKNRGAYNAAYRRLRAGKTRARIVVCAAPECGARWCRVPGSKKMFKYCSPQCELWGRRARGRRYWAKKMFHPAPREGER